MGDAIGREELTLTLREITDLERLIGRIVYGTGGIWWPWQTAWAGCPPCGSGW
ncbi:hypothetical protein M5E87_08180 [Flavonifractor plautii]|nr:hypothetical protein M5E87_08180 [Flavonifractor plautii]